jgi:hypothetical protein
MKKKNWILPGLVAILVAAYFLMVGFSPRATAATDKSTCCCQKMSVHGVPRTGPGGENCAAGTKGSASGEMILENLSRQFLSISPFGY